MAKKTPSSAGGRFDPRDPGARWAERELRPFAKLFTTRQQREIIEALAGTGDQSERERYEIFFQMIEVLTGDRFPPGSSTRDRLEMLRQEAELGRRRER
jgi:hypothetical protein